MLETNPRFREGEDGRRSAMRLDECPYFCRVRVTDLGSGASLDDDDMDNVEAFRGEIVVPWTEVKKAGDACVRGVVIPEVAAHGQCPALSAVGTPLAYPGPL